MLGRAIPMIDKMGDFWYGGEITYPDGSKFKFGYHQEDENKCEGSMTYPNGDVIEGILYIANELSDYPIPSKKDKFVPFE